MNPSRHSQPSLADHLWTLLHTLLPKWFPRLQPVRVRRTTISPSKVARKISTYGLLLLLAATFTGCETTGGGRGQTSVDRLALAESIRNEPPGDYYIGRRYYKQDYKFWGYVRRPGQPWSTAKMVLVNEHRKYAPDRAAGVLGSDNGVEYKLHGHFSGANVYEPASNAVYPEFVLTGSEVLSRTPIPIFRNQTGALDPKRREIFFPL